MFGRVCLSVGHGDGDEVAALVGAGRAPQTHPRAWQFGLVQWGTAFLSFLYKDLNGPQPTSLSHDQTSFARACTPSTPLTPNHSGFRKLVPPAFP